MNNRLLWNINIQGFLFATYGFSVQKLAEVPGQHGTEIAGAKSLLYWLIGILPIFGAAVSFFSWKGVRAAQDAIINLNTQWNEIIGDEYPTEKRSLLPKLIGGGDPKVSEIRSASKSHHKIVGWGFLAPRLFPWIFIWTWAALFLGYVLLVVHQN